MPIKSSRRYAPDERRTGRDNRPIFLQLYAASNILGVGVFTLPFLIPLVGLMPALVVPFGVGMVLSPLYQRLIVGAHSHTTARPETDTRRPTLGGPVHRIGGGTAASRLGQAAATMRGVPVVLAYLAIGEVAMTIIHQALDPFASARTLLGALLVVAVTGPFAFPRAALVNAVLRLARFWVVALLLVELTEPSGIVRSVIFVAGVAAGVVDMGSRRKKDRAIGRPFGGLRSEHASSAAVLAVQLIVMAGIAGCALATVAVTDRFEAPPLLVIPSAKQGIVAIGVVLFALTGTGHVNTATYPLMRTRRGIDTVIDGSLRLAVIVQGIWILTTAATVSTATLANLDSQTSFSTVGIADAVAETAPALGQVVLVLGAVLVLFALSSASHACTETLAIEYTAVRPHLTRRLQIGATVACAAVALALTGAGVAATSILSIAGLGGGILIMFVLPILAEPDPALQPRRRNQTVGITGSVIALTAASEILDGSTGRLIATLALGAMIVFGIARASSNINRRALGHKRATSVRGAPSVSRHHVERRRRGPNRDVLPAGLRPHWPTGPEGDDRDLIGVAHPDDLSLNAQVT